MTSFGSTGQLLTPNGTAVEIEHGQCKTIHGARVRICICEDGFLEVVCVTQVSNKLHQFKTAMADLVNELKRRKNDIKALTQDKEVLEKKYIQGDKAVGPDLLNTISMIGSHEEKIKELKGEAYVSVVYEDTTITESAVLQPGIITSVSFFSCPVVWCPRPVTEPVSEVKEVRTSDEMEMCLVGDGYWYGLGVQADETEAKRLYRLAADVGDKYAEGKCYELGAGTEVDEKAAVRCFRVCADRGEARAQYALGGCYDQGEGVEEDLTEAVRLYGLAAAQGHANAQFQLGDCYDHGEGVEENKMEAVRLYNLAAVQGHVEAYQRYTSTSVEFFRMCVLDMYAF